MDDARTEGQPDRETNRPADSALTGHDDGVPEPPWRKSRASERNRRPPLTRDAIVEAALAVIDRDGVEAASMRRVAEQLKTGAASLYWHVGDRNELLDLVLDRVAGEVSFPAPDPDRWDTQLKDVLREMRWVLLGHGDVARVTLDRFPLGPNAMVTNEALLAMLRAGGLPDRTCAYAAQLLPSFVGWYALEQASGMSPPGNAETSPDQMLAMARDYLGALPAHRFPHTTALVDAMLSGDPDDRFEFALDLLVSGLVAQAESSSAEDPA